MNIYYEFCNNGEFYYESRINVTGYGFQSQLMAHANRVWVEENGKVSYIKNRSASIEKIIPDIGEFVFIKLSARVLNVGKG